MKKLYFKQKIVLSLLFLTSYSNAQTTSDASVNLFLTGTDVQAEIAEVVSVIVTEIAPWSSGSVVAADWFEVTNNGTAALDITGWKVDDSSNLFTSALYLTGITSIAAGESVIFLETSATNSASIIANFKSAWFGTNIPANLQVGSYTGSAIGLSSSGDAVNLFNAAGVVQTSVTFGASQAAAPYATFDNSAGLTTVTQLSAVGINGAFVAVNSNIQTGSPGLSGGSLSTKNFQGIVTGFNVIAYPNPFHSGFRLDFKSANNDDVEMKVYDMVGKLLEARMFDAPKMNNQDSGNNYPSGIYNIVLKQGENTKTLRVIKK